MSKPKIAVSWNSSCGGCDESIVDIEEKILEIAPLVEFVLWPCAMDFKYEDVEKLGTKEITVSLINGGIQNSHQEHVVKMLREKSQLVVAFGSCAVMGGVPGLANLKSKEEIYNRCYIDSPTLVNPERTIPMAESFSGTHRLTLPEQFESLSILSDIVDVDYFLPGCPPTAKMIYGALQAILSGNLPPKGSVLAPDKALCVSCARNSSKPDILTISEVKRIHEIEADPNLCFLPQGVICMGPATRDGCDTACINGNMPCSGCLGPLGKNDQGAKMIGALGAMLGGETSESANIIMAGIPDPAGTFYRYSVASSLLGRKRTEKEKLWAE